MKHTAVRQVLAGVMIYFITIFQVFGQAALLPNAEQQYFNNNGQPLASGSVTYYVPGTTTLKTTWQNSNQTVNNTNPVNLDIGGKGIMYGQGSYRQVVQDNLGNTIWDQVTTAYGASSPSGSTGTDTAPVGTILPFSGFTLPTNWQLAYGQALSRTTYATLMAAITIQASSISCINTSTTLTGFADTSIIRIGAPIEATCLPTSTTVASITNATTIVVSQAAAATSTVTATIFPWGNGDQVSTFNVPDMRGRSPVGADCMGYVASGNACAGNLTATYYGSNPGAPGQTGGSQDYTFLQANLPSVNFTVSGITLNDPGHTHSPTAGNFVQNLNSSGVYATGGLGSFAPTTASATTGITISSQGHAASGGSGTPIPNIQPSVTTDYIIKVAPNTTGAGGVVSVNGLFGDVLLTAGQGLTATTSSSTSTIQYVCNTGSSSVLGCIQVDGNTITANESGVISAVGIAQGITVGTTLVTGGPGVLYNSVSGGSLAALSPVNSAVLSFSSGGIFQASTILPSGISATNMMLTTPNLGTPSAVALTNATGLPFSALPTGSLDTALGYFGSTTANAIAVPNCSGALTYSTTSHTLGCNNSAGTGTVTSTVCNGVTITTSGSCPPSFGFQNCSLAASVSGNNLTVALKDNAGSDPSAGSPCNVWFRNPTLATGSWSQVTQTAALSFVANAGSSFGSTNTSATCAAAASCPFRLWVVGINTGSGLALGIVDLTSAGGVLPLNEGILQSSTTCSACTNATALGTIYSTAGQASKPIVILGYLEWGSGLGTAGTYASAPTIIQTMGPGIRRPGEIVQGPLYLSTSTTTSCNSATFSVATALTGSITPTSSSNLIRVQGAAKGVTGVAAELYFQLSRGSGPALIGNLGSGGPATGSTVDFTSPLLAVDAPGVASSQSYTVYCKENGAAGTFNGSNSGTGVSTMTLEEIMG
jgi:Phage Tail Collar Domain